jgi:hypothetical protein
MLAVPALPAVGVRGLAVRLIVRYIQAHGEGQWNPEAPPSPSHMH